MKQYLNFKQPKNKNVKIWRFMDFSKYLSILDSETLFFSRADSLGDSYEGSLSRMNKKLHPIFYKDLSLDMRAYLSSNKKNLSKWMYINCWYMNEHESKAMWSFTQTDKSVVIQSTYNKLYNYLSSTQYKIKTIGLINYVDYEEDFIPENHYFSPFTHKRQEFDYEKEIRAIIYEPIIKNNEIQVRIPNEKKGLHIKTSVSDLIDAVYTNPDADIWFTNLVRNVTKKYKYMFNVKQSSMAKPPVF